MKKEFSIFDGMGHFMHMMLFIMIMTLSLTLIVSRLIDPTENAVLVISAALIVFVFGLYGAFHTHREKKRSKTTRRLRVYRRRAI